MVDARQQHARDPMASPRLDRRQANSASIELVVRASAVVGRLLRRVCADDVLQCPYGGRRSVIAIVADPTIARTLLTALGLPNEPATFAPARDPRLGRGVVTTKTPAVR